MSDKPSPYSYRVKSIKKIIDGDTFDCILVLGFDVLLEARVRMMGIDTPESRTRDLTEKKFGLLAKEYLTEKQLINNGYNLLLCEIISVSKDSLIKIWSSWFPLSPLQWTLDTTPFSTSIIPSKTLEAWAMTF